MLTRALIFFFLMIRRPPRSTLDRSSAASDVYKRQGLSSNENEDLITFDRYQLYGDGGELLSAANFTEEPIAVSYTHLRTHETVLDLVCRLLLAKKR